MPVNFKIDFIQGIVNDIQTGKISDAESNARAFAVRYRDTIMKGMPIGIPPTLPSAALGAPAPVGTGPGDAFGNPFVEASKAKMQNVLTEFYVGRDIVLSKESVEAKRRAIENIIRKAEYQTKVLQNSIQRLAFLTQKVKEAPQDIKTVIDTIKGIFEGYINDIKDIKRDMLSFKFDLNNSNINIEEEFKKEFAAEAGILNSLTNLDFSKPLDLFTTIQQITQQLEDRSRQIGGGFEFLSGSEEDSNVLKRYLNDKIKQIAAKFLQAAGAVLAPESLGELMLKIKADGDRVSEKVDRTLDKAIAASDRLGFLKFYIEPEIAKLQKYINKKKKDIKDELTARISVYKEEVDKDVREIAEKQLKLPSGKLSEKLERTKQEKDKLKDIADKVEKTAKKAAAILAAVGKLTSKTSALLQSGLTLKDEILGAIEDTKTQANEIFKKSQEAIAALNDSEQATIPSIDLGGNAKFEGEVRRYLANYDCQELVNTPLIQYILKAQKQDSGLTLLEVKKVLENSTKQWLDLYNKIKGLETGAYEIEDAYRELVGLVKINREEKLKPIEEANILSVFKLMDKVIDFIQKQFNDLVKWAKKVAADQKDKIDKFKSDAEIALLNSLPISVEDEDKKTRAQAAAEKKAILEQYKVKVQNTTKKAKAVSLATTNAAKIANNLGSGDFSFASNEKPLSKIADAKFEFFTIGIDPQSPAYTQQSNQRQAFTGELETLREIDALMSVVLRISTDLKAVPDRLKAQGSKQITNFVDILKEDYRSIIDASNRSITNFNDRGVRGVSPIIDKLFEVFEDLFGPNRKPNERVKAIKQLLAISEGDVLSQTLSAQPVVRTLVNLEKRHLQQTKVMLQKMLAIIPPDEEDKIVESATGESNPPPTGPLKRTADNAKEGLQKAKDAALQKLGSDRLYKLLKNVYDALDGGNASAIAYLIKELSKLLNKFEAFIKKQVTTLISTLRRSITALIQKNKEQYEQRLQAWLAKRDIVDLAANSVAYNLCTQLFWLGSTWQNSAGTTFQIIYIPPFRPLTANGRIDGFAFGKSPDKPGFLEQLAQRFETQLLNMQGICIPVPATGIPPLFFKGYK